MKNITEINIPQIFNTIYSNQKETPREIENENNSLINNIDINIGEFPDNLNNNNFNGNQFRTQEKEILLSKSCTYDLGDYINSNNIQNLKGKYVNINKTEEFVKKSKSLKENDKRINSFLGINNNGNNHLETVLETINEVSLSKINSSELNNSINESNIINAINNGSNKKINEFKQNKKDEYIFNSEQRVQYSENTTSALTVNNTKKSLYFI